MERGEINIDVKLGSASGGSCGSGGEAGSAAMRTSSLEGERRGTFDLQPPAIDLVGSKETLGTKTSITEKTR